MRQLIFSIAICSLCFLHVQAANISGIVMDKKTDSPVESASVVLLSSGNEVDRTSSKSDGSFLLKAQSDGVYLLLVNSKGFKEKTLEINTEADSKGTMPIYRVYLENIPMQLEGSVTMKSDGAPVPDAALMLTNQLNGSAQYFHGDEEGKYAIAIEPNTTYKLSLANTGESLWVNPVFISTVGVSQSMNIQRDLEISKLAEGTEKPAEEFVYRNDASSSAMEAKVAGLGISGKKQKIDVYGDDLYVIDKQVVEVDWTKKLQRERTKELPTIYFYAEIPKQDGPEVPERLPKTTAIESGAKSGGNLEQEAIAGKVNESTKQLPKEEAVKLDKAPERSYDTPVTGSNALEMQTGDIKTLDEIMDKTETIEQEISISRDSILNHEKTEIKLADDVKLQLQMQESRKPEKPVKATTVFKPKANTIYFDKGKSKILDAYKALLDEMVSRMEENRKMKLLLVAHTDNDMEYSIENYLSKLRAEAVQNYLMDQGISFQRLQIRVAGNKFPVNGCVYGVDCTEAEHRMNRRVELKVKANAPY